MYYYSKSTNNANNTQICTIVWAFPSFVRGFRISCWSFPFFSPAMFYSIIIFRFHFCERLRAFQGENLIIYSLHCIKINLVVELNFQKSKLEKESLWFKENLPPNTPNKQIYKVFAKRIKYNPLNVKTLKSFHLQTCKGGNILILKNEK